MPIFSSVSHALHWAFLLDSGAALEVRGRRAHVANGDETRTVDVGDMTASDLRVTCASVLRDARDALAGHHWAALCARFGHGARRVAGFDVLIDECARMTGADLAADAVALFSDRPAETPNARLLSSMRAALVAHALSSLPDAFSAAHVVPDGR